MSRKNIITNRLLDQQTGRQVHTTALTNFSLAGWENFQDPIYTSSNKLLLTDGVPTKLTFSTPVLFGNFTRQPQIGATKYPIWDFVDNKFLSYKENNNGNNSSRLQFVAEAQTAGTGVAIEISLFIPTYLTIYRESKPLVKGTNPQRVTDNIEFYYDDNTLQNGCEIYVTAIGDNVEIYNINLYAKNF